VGSPQEDPRWMPGSKRRTNRKIKRKIDKDNLEIFVTLENADEYGK
jgi:hypothetical protein